MTCVGSVISYNTGLGSYILGHRYPEGSDFTVTVDANLLKETLREQTTRVGEWLNVIGYITSCITTRGNEQDGVSNSQASVQALVIWPTGPLDVKQYEASFDGSDRQ